MDKLAQKNLIPVFITINDNPSGEYGMEVVGVKLLPWVDGHTKGSLGHTSRTKYRLDQVGCCKRVGIHIPQIRGPPLTAG